MNYANENGKCLKIRNTETQLYSIKKSFENQKEAY